MELIKDFKNLSKNDTSIAGGKGASLGEMTQADIPVPGGFVILSNTFEKFLEQTDLNVEIDSILDSVNHNEIHTIEGASEKISALILRAEIPQNIEQEIQKFFKNLNSKYVAVRSSATAEDSVSAAWAGQLESYLNTTEENLLENVKKCWASLFTPRAIFYRFEKGLHKQKISVAVVVQKMVGSEKSGIAFSVHPVTQDKNQLIIEAGFGLGEAIVSGQITPDSYVIEKQPRRIIDKNVQIQTKGLYRAKNGGNEWCDILKEQGEKQVLLDNEILELSEIILKIENHYNFPCDIEWAFENGKFHIVQSRPITTLNERGSSSIKILKNTFSREKKLYYFDLWNYCDRAGTKKYFATKFENNLFVVPKKGEKGSVWHVNTEMEQLKHIAIKSLKEVGAGSTWDKIKNDAWIAWNYIKPYALGETLENIQQWKDYQKHLLLFWTAMNSVVWESIDSPEINSVIREEFVSIRKESESFVERTSALATDYFEEKFSKYKDISHFLTFKEMVEIAEKRFSDAQLREIRKRLSGCFLLNGVVYADMENLPDTLKENNLKLEEEKIDGIFEIQGVTAMGGNVRGVVKIIRTKNEISRIKNGDILVTQMTSPDYVPAIKISSAIITDEGGSLCHAAIVSRELGIPCIIGTKIATQALKDGDLVEVDADNGVVKILEKQNEN